MLPKPAGGHISTEFIKIILICLKVEQSHKTKTGLLCNKLSRIVGSDERGQEPAAISQIPHTHRCVYESATKDTRSLVDLGKSYKVALL